MNDRLDLLVTDWLHADAPTSASPRVLEGALARVTTAGQERYVTQRLLGDAFGRRRDVRLAMAVFLVVLGLVGAVAVIGALLPKETIPVGPLSNGPIVFRANGDAGADLTQPVINARGGDRDLYAADDAGGIRRIVGDDADHLLQDCPTVSPDGSHLAYLELDSTSITPTQAPVPEGQPFLPAPAPAGPLRYAFGIVALDAAGTPTGQPTRIAPPGPPDSIVDCPHWSPDGSTLAFNVDAANGGGLELWVASLDGRTTRLATTPFAPNLLSGFDWAPDGTALVVGGESGVSVVPADGGPARPLLAADQSSVAWSPDAARIAVTTHESLVVVSPDGQEVFRRLAPTENDPTAFWSPDGSSLAHVQEGILQIEAADGASRRAVPVDVGALFPDVAPDGSDPNVMVLAWSPDGQRLLLAVSPAFDQTGLVIVSAAADRPPVVVVQPTLALTGMRPGQASWQGVHR